MGSVLQQLRKHWRKHLGGLVLIGILAGIATPRVKIITRFRTKTPFALAHKRAINTFVDSEGFGIRRMAQEPPDKYWAEMSFILEGDQHEISSVNLIGTTKEHVPRFFTTYSPPSKDEIESAKSRRLTSTEEQAIGELRSKASGYVINTDPLF